METLSQVVDKEVSLLEVVQEEEDIVVCGKLTVDTSLAFIGEEVPVGTGWKPVLPTWPVLRKVAVILPLQGRFGLDPRGILSELVSVGSSAVEATT